MYSAFAKAVGASLKEVEQPLSAYPTFSSFFARRLRGGARRFVCDDDAFISPSDGRVSAVGTIESGRLLQAKNHFYQLKELLDDVELAKELEGGTYVTIYLSPKDYHRVHAPCVMQISGYTHVPGSLYPVGPRAAARIDGLFARNERVVIPFEADGGKGALVMVAAIGVGNIELSNPPVRLAEPRRFHGGARWTSLDAPITLTPGQDLGAFHLGSTVILCLGPGSLLEQLEVGQSLVVGQPLGQKGRS